MGMKYAIQNYDEKRMAKACNRDMPVSTKHTIEICTFLKHRKLQTAKKLLNEVIRKETPVPYRRFNRDVAHRKGELTSGRFPVKAAAEVLAVIESVEKNAQNKGLSVNDLVISHICANRGTTTMRYGRHRGQAKRTHVEVVVQESKKKKEGVESKVKEVKK